MGQIVRVAKQFTSYLSSRVIRQAQVDMGHTLQSDSGKRVGCATQAGLGARAAALMGIRVPVIVLRAKMIIENYEQYLQQEVRAGC
jgi:hypothetical protein